MKIAIIGSTGMLGSALLKFFNLHHKEFELIIPKRFDYYKKLEFLDSLNNPEYIINCSGAIPQRIPDFKDERNIFNYYKINYLIPELLIENEFKVINHVLIVFIKVIQNMLLIALNSKYDCIDLYGRSKAKLYSGEIYKKNINSIKVIRSSIVGTDKLNKSLYSWN